MSDFYQQFATSAPGKLLVKRLGLPNPVPLRRYRPGQRLVEGPVHVGSAEGGRLRKPVEAVLDSARVEVASSASLERYAALVFDASGITDTSQLHAMYEFFHPVIRRVQPSGRVIVLGTPPEEADGPRARAAQRSLEGFTRSVGKELRAGATSQLVYVSPGAEDAIESTLRFLLSAKSAYVSAQVIRIRPAAVENPRDPEQPLEGKTALVTGASRGIGAAIAEVLARDGARVVCLDVPAQGDALAEVANRIGGTTLQLDITAEHAGQAIADHFAERFGGLDIMVHNAGITRDKTLGKMDASRWDSVIGVNVSAQERINDTLLSSGVLRTNGRLIGVASIAGIAGNFGQTNYGTSKAAVIGHVQALADRMAEHGSTINAVAPGFIETRMTAAIPLFTREAGRRMNSMAQGGLPRDVAETIAWYANPGSTGVNGNVVRVCGQSLLGGVRPMPVLDRSPDLLPLFSKAAVAGFTKHGGDLPETEYVLNRVRIDLDHLAAYDRVCGFRLGNELPATYPHILGFPLQTKLMTDPEFPFPLIGSVHVANRITVHRPLRVDDVLELRVHAENLRDHRRGKQFDVVTTASVDGAEAWRDVSTYLRRGGGSGGGSRQPGSGDDAEPPRPVAYWRVPGDIGRRYAAVAGDANPIHLHPLTAKAFGFPRTIAHGMWIKARCLAALQGQLPPTFTVDVRFKKPVLLPAKVAFRASRSGDGWEFDLSDARKGKPHLAGSLG